MPYTRVKDPETGHEYSTLVVVEGLQVLDKPAEDAYGQPLPAKHNRPLSSLTDASGTKVSDMPKPALLDYAAANGVLVDDENPTKDVLLAAIAAHEGDDYQTTDASGGGDTPAP